MVSIGVYFREELSTAVNRFIKQQGATANEPMRNAALKAHFLTLRHSREEAAFLQPRKT